MDEKGFTLGTANKAKVTTHAGRQLPRTTHDETRELITVIEVYKAKQAMLPPMVVFKGTAHYKGWYTEVTEEKHAYFAYSPKGYTTDEIGLEWLKKFDAQTKMELAGPTLGEYRLLLLDGHRSHYNLHFCEYAWDNRIILVSYPGHSTHLLQPLDVGLFALLQKAYGDLVAAHMKETQTGLAKGTFWAFYCAAQAKAYTPSNIKSAWRATGIVPYNPDAVLTKLPGYKPPGRAVPKVPTTPRSFKLLQTPMNRRELRQQTLSAIEFLNANPTLSGTTKESSITLLRRHAHQSKSALTRCQIAEIEAADVRQKYAGKHAPRTNRTKLPESRVVGNVEVVQLKKEDAVKEEEKLRKAQAKATRAQAKAAQGGTGQGTGRGGRGGQGGQSGRPPPVKVWSRNQL